MASVVYINGKLTFMKITAKVSQSAYQDGYPKDAGDGKWTFKGALALGAEVSLKNKNKTATGGFDTNSDFVGFNRPLTKIDTTLPPRISWSNSTERDAVCEILTEQLMISKKGMQYAMKVSVDEIGNIENEDWSVVMNDGKATLTCVNENGLGIVNILLWSRDGGHTTLDANWNIEKGEPAYPEFKYKQTLSHTQLFEGHGEFQKYYRDTREKKYSVSDAIIKDFPEWVGKNLLQAKQVLPTSLDAFYSELLSALQTDIDNLSRAKIEKIQ